jgi:Zn-dependent protease
MGRPNIAGMMLESGYLHIGRFRGVPIRVHVLTPLGALFFSGFRFEPGAWLGFVLLILAHEMGHALLVMRYGLGVSSIDLHAYGGATRWSGLATERQRTVVAWGGVLAQAALFAVTLALVATIGGPRSLFGRELVYVFTTTNVWLMALNLLPFPPLDGAQAWKIAGELKESWRSRSLFDVRRWRMPRGFGRRDSSPPSVSPDEARRIAKAFEDAVRRR